MTASLHITGFYAAVLGLFQILLTFGIIFIRVNDQISIGSGGNQVLEYRIRCHGNFIETVPIALILLALVEYQKYLSSYYLNIVASAFVISRLLHAHSMFFLKGKGIHRPIGMITTVTCVSILSIVILLNTQF